jgi:hypothetical protein
VMKPYPMTVIMPMRICVVRFMILVLY